MLFCTQFLITGHKYFFYRIKDVPASESKGQRVKESMQGKVQGRSSHEYKQESHIYNNGYQSHLRRPGIGLPPGHTEP